jgi:hypothetical protein
MGLFDVEWLYISLGKIASIWMITSSVRFFTSLFVCNFGVKELKTTGSCLLAASREDSLMVGVSE